jgi:imidazolonepropionase-like amidohydrolase
MKMSAKSFRRLCAALLTGSLVSAGASAETLFINDATVHTVSSRGVLQQGDILVRDGRITAIGVGLQAPADANVIEAEGRPVTPGFFAGVTALGLEEISLEDATVDTGLDVAGLRPEFDVTPAFNPHSSAIPVTRIEGLTWTVLGAKRTGSFLGGQGRAVSLDGGYDSFLGAQVLFIDVGADASEQSAGSRAWQWMQLDRAMQEAEAEISWSPEPLLTVAGRSALASFRAGGHIVFQADRASDILQVLKFSEKHGLRAVISGGAEAWMVADRLAEAGMPVMLDALLNLPKSFDMLGARLDNAAILNEAGVTVAFGAAETHNARKLRQVAGNAVANGLPFEAGIAAMTLNPAIIFGLEEELGALAEDKAAHLVLWSGDPLEVTTAADQVIISGKMVDMVSRQTLLRDRYLPRDPELPRAYLKP